MLLAVLVHLEVNFWRLLTCKANHIVINLQRFYAIEAHQQSEWNKAVRVHVLSKEHVLDKVVEREVVIPTKMSDICNAQWEPGL